MKPRFGITLLIAISVVLISFDLPKGWIISGDNPDDYEMGIDPKNGMDGSKAATIKSITKNPKGTGVLMQQSKPDSFLGKRVKLSAFVKSKGIMDWAGMWLRVDGGTNKEFLSFDNMYDRPIKGTTDWLEYSIVLDVPEESTMLAYGALLNGGGQIWFDNVKIEVVDETTPLTGRNRTSERKTLSNPYNLNFEE